MYQQKAMSLVEVIIAMAVFAVVTIAMLTFFANFADNVKTEEQIADLDRTADRAVDKMSQELRGAFIPGDAPADWVTPLNAGAADISYLVAVDHDNDNDELDANLAAEWGCIREDYSPGEFLDLSRLTDPNNPTDRFYQQYRFVENGTFDEAAQRADINNDGDSTDTFALGYIEKRYLSGSCTNAGSVHNGVNAPEVLVRLTGDIVIQGQDTNGDGDPDLIDLDNDGDTDPIFSLNGTQLTINLFVTKMNEKIPVIRRVTSTVELRNMD
ncbi:MAG: PulJ/GspJ family protein [Planctomycetota bacterium]|jgi:prepilin-type N-terminal cleavage/methylation domain-containing protein